MNSLLGSKTLMEPMHRVLRNFFLGGWVAIKIYLFRILSLLLVVNVALCPRLLIEIFRD